MAFGTNNYENYCPLCGGNNIEKKYTFNKKTIIDLYRRSYNYDISYLFKDIGSIHFLECKKCGLKYFYPDIGGDDRFYRRLQKNKNYYFKDKYEFQVVRKYFTKEMNVLEIGAGKGAFSKLIPFKTYTGIELNKSAVLMAKKEGVNLYHGTIQEFAISIHSKFDIVCSFQVLEHVYLKDLYSFIKSSTDVLRKGGKMIIAVPSDDSFLSKTTNVVLNLPPHHLSRWSEKVFFNMENIFNIKVTEIFKEPLKEINYDPYLLFKIKERFNIETPPVKEDILLYEKIMRKIIKHIPIFIKRKIVRKNRAKGHSIIVIFEKL